MPRVESTIEVELPLDQAFALSQTTGALRLQWDPFIHEQHLLDGAAVPGKGVRTATTSRHRLHMVSEYVSYRPPTQVGMKMVSGPWFFAQFSGGWTFGAVDEQRTRATWRYTFACRPRWLRPISHRIGQWLLGRDIERRLAAFGRAAADPAIVGSLPPDPPPVPSET